MMVDTEAADDDRRSSSTGHPKTAVPTGGLGRLAFSLRLSPDSWRLAAPGDLKWPAITVIGGWLLLSWIRLGPQALFNPRAMMRFVLVGVYGWLGLGVGLWLVAMTTRWLRPGGRARSPGSELAWPSSIAAELGCRVRLAGMAHQTLVAAAFVVYFLQLVPQGLLTTIVAVIPVLLWMPGQLVAAVAFVDRRPMRAAAAPTLIVWGGWLATAGWYLMARVGHAI